MPSRKSVQSQTTLLIPPEYRERLEKMAKELGFRQTRGAGAGKTGNISALVCAIAKGELRLIKVDTDATSKVSEMLENTAR